MSELNSETIQSDLWDRIIEKNIPYYRVAATEWLKSERKKSRFNWSAAILTGGWFGYRKMYKYGLIVTAIEMLVVNIFGSLFPSQINRGFYVETNSKNTVMQFIFICVVGYVIGRVANKIYFKYIDDLFSSGTTGDDLLIQTGTSVWSGIGLQFAALMIWAVFTIVLY